MRAKHQKGPAAIDRPEQTEILDHRIHHLPVPRIHGHGCNRTRRQVAEWAGVPTPAATAVEPLIGRQVDALAVRGVGLNAVKSWCPAPEIGNLFPSQTMIFRPV